MCYVSIFHKKEFSFKGKTSEIAREINTLQLWSQTSLLLNLEWTLWRTKFSFVLRYG